MSKIAYFECPTGIAGDMCLGALLDAGVPLPYLQEQLRGLELEQAFVLTQEAVYRQGQRATKAWVEVVDQPGIQPHRHLPEIQRMIQAANLPTRVEQWSLEIFQVLAIAEGQVHGVAPESVHFHEVGAIDALVDIVGTCLGLDWLGIDQLYCSALPTGGGTVQAAHGTLPVPVPAVLQLLSQRSVPVYHNNINRELVTPTGAAIAVTLASSFGDPPPMILDKLGLGAGQAEFAIPNLLRLWLGSPWVPTTPDPWSLNLPIPTRSDQSPITPASPETIPGTIPETITETITEAIVILETQVDDMTPQGIGYLFDVLMAGGAVDVLTQSVGMKKSRPGILIQVFCLPDKVEACETLLFRETTTLGIRRRVQQRRILARRCQRVETPYGSVRVKVAYHGDEIMNIQPEYEDCRRIAQETQIPWRNIQQMVMQLLMQPGADLHR